MSIIKEARTRYEGVVFDVVTRVIDTSSRENSGTGEVIVRDIVTKKPCVVALVKDTSTSKPFAILVNEFRVGTMKRENGFPAGFIDDGETPIQAIVREVIEETGLIPYHVEYLGDAYTSSGFTDEHIYYFYIEVNSKNKREQDLDHDEKITLVYIPFDDVYRYIVDGKLTGNHAHACLLKYFLKHCIDVR